MSGWARAWLAVGAFLVVVLVVLAALWLTRETAGLSVTLRDRLGPISDIHAEDATAELCATVECVEGWRTDVGNFLWFSRYDSAEYWQYVIGGDSIAFENVVLDRNGLELSLDDRRRGIDILFSSRDWHLG